MKDGEIDIDYIGHFVKFSEITLDFEQIKELAEMIEEEEIKQALIKC